MGKAHNPASPGKQGIPDNPGNAGSGFRDQALFPTAAMTVYQLLKTEGDSSASYMRIRQTLHGDLKGISIQHVKNYLEKHGIQATVRQEPLESLLDSGRPGIILTRTRHTIKDPTVGQYVLCVGREKDGVRIVDPMVGRSLIQEENLKNRYLGVNLRLEKDRKVPAENAPDLSCEEFVWSFGEVPSGTEVRHSFEIVNTGDRPLHIDRVETTCGCAAAMVGKKNELADDLIKKARPEKENNPKKLVVQKNSGGLIEPGERAWISAYVNTLHKQGYMAFRVKIRSNDPEEPEFYVSLQGTVIRVFEYEPVTVWFREVKSSEGAFEHMWVRHHRAKPFKISGIKTTSQHVGVWVDDNPPRQAPPTRNPSQNMGLLPRDHPRNQGWVGLKVMVLPGAPIGTFSATISFKADDTPIEANLAALIKGNIVVEPGYFSFGNIKKGKPEKVAVTVRSEIGKAFKIEKVEVNKDFMKPEIQPAGDGVYRITLGLVKDWNDYDLQGVVTVYSNDPLEPQKKILVYGFIRRS